MRATRDLRHGVHARIPSVAKGSYGCARCSGTTSRIYFVMLFAAVGSVTDACDACVYAVPHFARRTPPDWGGRLLYVNPLNLSGPLKLTQLAVYGSIF